MEAVNDLSAILRACYSRIMHTINCIVAADMRYRDCKIFLFFWEELACTARVKFRPSFCVISFIDLEI